MWSMILNGLTTFTNQIQMNSKHLRLIVFIDFIDDKQMHKKNNTMRMGIKDEHEWKCKKR